jgi:RNA-directed DNA polymerase
MPGDVIARSWIQGAAWLRAISYAAPGVRGQRSTSEPSPFGWSATYAINILPLKAQIKRRVSCSPPLYRPFKLKVCFCVRGVLSPLLANVLLDEVDQALTKRGHRFARYADDCNVYVRSQKAGERVLRWMRKLYAQLHLRVNEKKTEVGSVFGRKFLGYCLRRWTGNTVKMAVAPKAIETFKQRIKTITKRVGGRGMTQVAEQMREYLPGWKSYFRLAQTPQTFKNLDSWVRHRLRAIQLKHWRTGTTIYSRLRSLGATHEQAALMAGGAGHWWRHSEAGLNRILTVKYFDSLGFPRLT